MQIIDLNSYAAIDDFEAKDKKFIRFKRRIRSEIFKLNKLIKSRRV